MEDRGWQNLVGCYLLLETELISAAQPVICTLDFHALVDRSLTSLNKVLLLEQMDSENVRGYVNVRFIFQDKNVTEIVDGEEIL